LIVALFLKFILQSLEVNNSSNINNNTNDIDLDKQIAYRSKFKEHMKFIKSKYPNQTNLFWANIESTFRHSIIKSKDPSIILIVNDQLTSNLAHELTYDILNTIKLSIEDKKSFNLQNLIINPFDFNNLIQTNQWDKVKLLIDDKLNRIFSSGQRVALVRNIQDIPAKSMLLFYTYGDDLLSAKYPGVVILMNLHIDYLIESTDRDVYSKSSRKIIEFTENYLFKLWSNYVMEDQLKPLFTRIGNNVIFVNNESK
jgi:hypothetical protein